MFKRLTGIIRFGMMTSALAVMVTSPALAQSVNGAQTVNRSQAGWSTNLPKKAEVPGYVKLGGGAETPPPDDEEPVTVGDNMGDHSATQNLIMNNFQIVNSGNITMRSGGKITNVRKLTMNGQIDMRSSRIINVAGPVDPSDVVNKNYVDNLIANAGDDMGDSVLRMPVLSGDGKVIDMSEVERDASGRIVFNVDGVPLSKGDGLVISKTGITRLSAPVNDADAVNKLYVDSLVAAVPGDNLGNHTATRNLNIAGFKVTNVAAPTAAADAANKAYVDARVAAVPGDNLGNHVATRALAMSNFKITGLATPTAAADATTKAYVDALVAAVPGDNLGNHVATRALAMSNFKITGLATPTAAADATTKAYVDALFSSVPTIGDNLGNHTATRDLSIAGFKVTNVAAPTAGPDAANKAYVDALVAAVPGDNLGNHTATRNLSIAGFKVTNVAVPTVGSDAANKAYVDALVAAVPGDNLGNHTATRALAMSNFKITGLATPTAAADATTKAYVDALFSSVPTIGDNLGNHTATRDLSIAGFKVTNVATPTAGTDAANKAYVDSRIASGGGSYAAGDGLNLSGNEFSVDASVVRTSGSQTIDGTKTFTSTVVGQGSLLLMSDANTGVVFRSAAGVTKGFVIGQLSDNSMRVRNYAGDGTTVASELMLAADGRILPAVGRLSGANRAIVEVADPVASTDAVNLRSLNAAISAGAYTAGSGLTLSGRQFAVDATVVRTSGSQRIDGTKTFSADVIGESNFVIRDAGDTGYLIQTPTGVQKAALIGYSDGTTRLRNYNAAGTAIINDLLFTVDGRIMPGTGRFSGNAKVISDVADPVAAADAVNLRSLNAAISAGAYTAGSGLTLSGRQFAVDATVVRTSGSQRIDGTKTFSADVIGESNFLIRDAGDTGYWIQTPAGASKAALIGYSDGTTRLRNYNAAGTAIINELIFTLDGRIMPGAGKLSGNGKVISDLADPVASTDAVNLRSLNAAISGAYTAGSGLTLTGRQFAVDASVVRTSGNQRIDGTKTFSADVIGENNFVIRDAGNTGYLIQTPTGVSKAALIGYSDGTTRLRNYNAAGTAVINDLLFTVDGRIMPGTGKLSGGAKVISDVADPVASADAVNLRSLNGAFADRTITAVAPITGGGALTSDVSIGLAANQWRRGYTDVNPGVMPWAGSTKTAGQFYGGAANPTGTGRINFDGMIYGTRFYSTQYLYFSDARLKKDVLTLPAQDGLEIVRKIRPVSYTWKQDGRKALGVIAQEVRDVVPTAVSDRDGSLSVDYMQLIAPMAGAVQQLDDEVISLRAEVKSLEHRVSEMEKLIRASR